jgi:DNA polymerase I-like protein with 3'-5' exonuclease and polymerase domains
MPSSARLSAALSPSSSTITIGTEESVTKVIAFDTETRGLDWFDERQRAFLATTADGQQEWAYDLSDPAQVADFVAQLEAADILVAHNLSFDVHHVREAIGLDILTLGAELHDTDTMSRLLFPAGQRGQERGGHGLKHLATIYLDPHADAEEEAINELAKTLGYKNGIKPSMSHPHGEPWLAYYDVWRAYPLAMEAYAVKDARYTYDLYQMFRPMLEGNERLLTVYDLEMQVAPVLIEAERLGTAVDSEQVEALRQHYSEREKTLRADLERELGENALGGEGSEAALEEALLGMGVPLHRKTKTGKLSTNKYALQEFEDDFPVLQTLEEYRQATKFLGTYLAPMRGRTVVHPSFIQVGAWTGRMSCRRPNMQNIPVKAGPEVRSVFVARPGHKLIVSDYDSIEVRLLAYYLGSEGESYRELIREGHDPHAYMAAQIHGGTMADFLKGTPGEKERAIAKNTMFAITYGAGGPRVADMNKIEIPEARALIKTIKESLPGYYRLMRRIKNKIELNGYVQTIAGRTQPVDREKSYVGLNALIQGSAADIMKAGLLRAADALKPFGGSVLLVVHDEVVSEVPAAVADAALAAQNDALTSAGEDFNLDPPLLASGKVVDTYGEAK